VAGILTPRHFYYSTGWRDLEERIGTAATADRQFVWGVRCIDDLVLRDYGSQRYFAAQDGSWNVTSIVDSTAVVRERYAYSPYGAPIFLTPTFVRESASICGWETLCCGYRYDVTSSLFSVRFRYYHPGIGCWTARDPLRSIRQTNLYAYVGSMPTRYCDPFGLQDPGPGPNDWIPAPDPDEGEFFTLDAIRDAFIAGGRADVYIDGMHMYNIINRENSIWDFLDFDGSVWSNLHRGCVGVVSAMCGRYLTANRLSPKHAQDCYHSLEKALAETARMQKARTCCSKGEKGPSNNEAQPVVFGFYWADMTDPFKPRTRTEDPITGRITWNQDIPEHRYDDANYRASLDDMLGPGPFGYVFDYGLYDPQSGGFWSADFDFGSIKLTDMTKYQARLGSIVYCVICQGKERFL
jgi:RHS repeat-associated protein